jgi:hypothetical protein
MPRPPRVRRVSPRNAAPPTSCAATIAKRSTPGSPRTNPGTAQANCPAPACAAATATVTGRSTLTSLTTSPVTAGRLPNDSVGGITREGAVEVGADVKAGAPTAVVAGEGAAVGRGVDVDSRGVAVGSADGNGDQLATGSEAEGSGRMVAIGSDAEGRGRIVAIGSGAVGSGRSVLTGSGRGGIVTPGNTDGGASVGSSGKLGPAAAADLPRPNPPIRTSAAKATATAPRLAR